MCYVLHAAIIIKGFYNISNALKFGSEAWVLKKKEE
jgi:hypothetical protein